MYTHRSQTVYLVDPRELRLQGLEVNQMSEQNCYAKSLEHKDKDAQARKDIWNKLKKEIEVKGFDKGKPIEIWLQRLGSQDKLNDGHHRLSIAIDLGLSHVPVVFVWGYQLLE